MARAELFSAQLAQAAEAFPGTRATSMADGGYLVEVPLDLPPGWNRTHAMVRFLVPVAFPVAQLDCFFADADLRLASGAMPANSGMQLVNGDNLLWFSWHLTSWDPLRDSLMSFIRFINERFRRGQ
jgi:hypothetical protein